MARIKILFPDTYHFETEIRVRINDINYGHHLSNDAVLRMMHDSRCQFYEAFGYTELDIEGCGSIMSGCSIQYLNEAFYNDVLHAKIAVTDFNAIGFNLKHKFTRISDDNIIAIGLTEIVLFDYKKKKVMKVPPTFKEKFIM